MKITKNRLKHIIKEELETVLGEDQFKNDPNYQLVRVVGGKPVYRRRDRDDQGRAVNPDIGKERKIQDNAQTVMRILMQIKGMEQDRAKEILNRIGDAPMKQLGSYLRMNLSHAERAQIDQHIN